MRSRASGSDLRLRRLYSLRRIHVRARQIRRHRLCGVQHQQQGGQEAPASSRLRGTFGRTSTVLPVASTPCGANTSLARSIPRVTMATEFPFVHTAKSGTNR